MDFDWKFALGHAYDPQKDFENGTGYFSYFAKAGYGDGAAAQNFDDRAWRKINLPHDWCVELPFDARGSHSHGFKAVGRNFPENSIGWYRKTFFIPQTDLGKRISVEFDGVFRNSMVWVNGFYLATEQSGYKSFSYDISDYLNYGEKNVIAVRVDATMEEGWFYEGAGIYRHVWLTKTSPLHLAHNGTFVTSKLKNDTAEITIRSTVVNETSESMTFDLNEKIKHDKNIIASGMKKNLTIPSGCSKEFFSVYLVPHPKLWTIDDPVLNEIETSIESSDKMLDEYRTSFGIRTIRFDADKGFFLNGQPVKIKGVCNHQDHAGVGTAIPDALQDFRINRLKEMGCNAIRTSHNPPTPEFLDACDRLGMLVLDENRLMGSNEEQLKNLEQLIKRDRNHPSVILWSLGNEEWFIEGDKRGARIATTMQTFAQRLDSSRAFTTACSGGWDSGIGTVSQVMGYNYIVHGDIDGHHSRFPRQASIGTEESNTSATRGIYTTDKVNAHLEPTNPGVMGAEAGWKFYYERPFLSGLFYWTGFDYRGEPTPFRWPAVTSQYGIVDLCGFPKDVFYYFKSWWSNKPILHIMPHWNWEGKEGMEIPVTVYSNCEQIELFLNNKSLGKQNMPLNGHLEWKVKYEKGVLSANGYSKGKKILTEKMETVGIPELVKISAEKNNIKANGKDISVITVQVNDAKDRLVPTANNEIRFRVEGPGKIIGVENGDPSSHEADQFIETIKTIKFENLKELAVPDLFNRQEVRTGMDDSNWKQAFTGQSEDWKIYTDSFIVVRGTFVLPSFFDNETLTFFSKSITENQSIYINGHLIASDIIRDAPNQTYLLDHSIITSGKNEYAITGKRFRKINQWDHPNTDPGLIQIVTPPGIWKRKVFNGLAQIIISSSEQNGEIVLTAISEGLTSDKIKISSIKNK